MKRYRLLAKAEIDGTVRDVGYEFERPDDWDGPKTVGQMLTAEGMAWAGVPLYAEIVPPIIAAPALIPPDIAAPVPSDPDDPRLKEMLALVDKLGEPDV
jgi:hypothetical protein